MGPFADIERYDARERASACWKWLLTVARRVILGVLWLIAMSKRIS